jgi:hypothetical protein
MKGWVNDNCKRAWKEGVVAYFWGPIPPFAWREWGEPRNSSARIAGLRAEIWTRVLPSKAGLLPTRPQRSQECVKLTPTAGTEQNLLWIKSQRKILSTIGQLNSCAKHPKLFSLSNALGSDMCKQFTQSYCSLAGAPTTLVTPEHEITYCEETGFKLITKLPLTEV